MMKKLKINETIVVEGKHDAARIKALVDAEVLITNGTHVSMSLIQLLKRIQCQQGVIVFTDQDTPGKQIRNKLNAHIPHLKHAVLTKKQDKVGVEHASSDEILRALQEARGWDAQLPTTLDLTEFNELGLNGKPDSRDQRDVVAKHFRLPKSNAKQLLKLLNMIGVNKQQIEEIL